MWKLLSQPKTQRVTKKLAEEFCNMEACPQDRNLSEIRLRVYSKAINENRFRPVCWAKTRCMQTGGLHWVRVNGKHTSLLMSMLDPMPEFYATVEEYVCDTLEDVAKLYATYDSKLQSRSVSDINRSFVACIPELAEIPMKTCNMVISALAFHKDGDFFTIKRQPAERAEAIFEEIDFCLWVHKTFGDKKGKGGPLCRIPVCAAAYATYKREEKKATKFWTAVREETGETPDLPDRKLAKFLSTNYARNPGATCKTSRHNRAEPNEFYAKCLHAWNLWREGRKADL